jgi:hypothetical protein
MRISGGLGVVFVNASFLMAQSVSIQTSHDSPQEQQAKAELERLRKQYETTKYTFTSRVVTEYDAVPHSDPVLTLNTQHFEQDEAVLSTYVHEPIHWFLDAREGQTKAAEEDLKKLYPDSPAGGDEGAHDLESDYLHRIVCELEREADLELLGSERTKTVTRFWATDHYKWTHRTVTGDHDKIQEVIKTHSLEIL